MKTTFIILICLPFFATAQNKKDNAIIIHENLSPQKITEVLFENGYSLNKTDSNFISTDTRQTKSISIKMSLQKRDSTWILKGWGKLTVEVNLGLATTYSDYEVIYYGGMKGSALRESWNELDKIATALSDKIEYIKQ
jgi:hypothetical protein